MWDLPVSFNSFIYFSFPFSLPLVDWTMTHPPLPIPVVMVAVEPLGVAIPAAVAPSGGDALYARVIPDGGASCAQRRAPRGRLQLRRLPRPSRLQRRRPRRSRLRHRRNCIGEVTTTDGGVPTTNGTTCAAPVVGSHCGYFSFLNSDASSLYFLSAFCGENRS